MEKLELKNKLLTILQFDDFELSDIDNEIEKYKEHISVKDTYEVIKAASKVLGIPVIVMKSKSKKRKVVRARAFVFYYYRVVKFNFYSQQFLGDLFQRDHTTVLYTERNFPNDLAVNFEGTNDDFQRFLTILEDTKTEQNG